MTYQVKKKDIPAVRVAYMTYQGPAARANELFPAVFESINKDINGNPFFIYHQMDPQTMTGIIDVCEATEKTPDNPNVKTKTVPGIQALTTIHVGTYETIHMAYQAIHQYAAVNAISLTLPGREIFIKGPEQEYDAEKYITEVVIPIV